MISQAIAANYGVSLGNVSVTWKGSDLSMYDDRLDVYIHTTSYGDQTISINPLIGFPGEVSDPKISIMTTETHQEPTNESIARSLGQFVDAKDVIKFIIVPDWKVDGTAGKGAFLITGSKNALDEWTSCNLDVLVYWTKDEYLCCFEQSLGADNSSDAMAKLGEIRAALSTLNVSFLG